MKCIPFVNIGIRIIILASFGCNYFFSAIACETLYNGCPGSNDRTPPPLAEVELLINVLNSYPQLIHTEQVLIQPNPRPICVVVVESTKLLAQMPEFQRNKILYFSSFKAMLLANDFSVYEFMHAHNHLPGKRQVIFTHDAIRNQTSCTTAAVTTILAGYSAFKYRNRGLEHYIWQSNVTFIEKQRKDPLIDSDLLRLANSRSDIASIQALLMNLLSACPDLIYMNRAQIQPHPHFFCGIIIARTGQLMNRVLLYRQFSKLKTRLLAVGFTVYEYNHSETNPIPYNRQVILTHDSFRDEAQCTIESVSRLSHSRFRGQTKFIEASDVRLLNELHHGARRPVIPQSTPIFAPQAASGRAQARWAQQTNVALQQSISKANHKRNSVQDVGRHVGPGRHKNPRSSSSNAVRELDRSCVVDASGSSYRPQLDVAFNQSPMMELPSSIESGTAFHYTPDASVPRNLPPSVPNYRPMEYGEMPLSERDRSIRSSGPQQMISNFDLNQMEIPSWSEIASIFDITPNVSPSESDGFLKERDEMSLNELLQSISNFLDY